MEVSVLAPDSPSLQVVNDLNTDEYEEVEVDLHKAALKAISQRPSIIDKNSPKKSKEEPPQMQSTNYHVKISPKNKYSYTAESPFKISPGN